MVDDVCLQLESLDMSNKSPTGERNKSEEQGVLSTTKSIAGWNGIQTKSGVISPRIKQGGKKDTSRQESGAQKRPRGKKSPPSSNELKRRHGVSSGTRRTLFPSPSGKKSLTRKSINPPTTPGGTQSSILMFMSGKKKIGIKAGGSLQMLAAKPAED